MGGMATFYETLLASSLPNRIDLTFVQTSSQTRMFEQSGRLSFSNIISSLSDCWQFTMAIMKHKPQIAHIGTAFGLSFLKHSICIVIAHLFGSRVLLHPHCSYQVLYASRSPIWKSLFLWLIGITDGVIALSQEWSALAAVAPQCKVFTLPNAVNLRIFREIAQKHMSSCIGTRALHILYLGHIGKAKGSFDLVDAAKSILHQGKRCEIQLIGGELSPGEGIMLRNKIKVANLERQVHIYSPVTGAEKLAAFCWADIFVYPSYDEGMPVAVIEAMACGIPVIASRVGGLPDLVTEGINGLLVDSGHPEQIAAAIRYLADKPKLRAEMGRQSYQRAVNDYDFEKRVAQLVKIYSTVLNKGCESNA